MRFGTLLVHAIVPLALGFVAGAIITPSESVTSVVPPRILENAPTTETDPLTEVDGFETDSPMAVAEGLASLDSKARRAVFQRLFGEDLIAAEIAAMLLAESNPRAVLALLAGVRASDDRAASMKRIGDALFRTWADKDPDAAVKAVASLRNDALKSSAVCAVMDVIFEKNPQNGLDLAMTWRHEFGYGETLPKWMHENPAETCGLASEELNLSILRERIASVIPGIWARTDGHAALAWVSDFHDARRRSNAQSQVVHAWASGDPKGAMDAFSANTFANPAIRFQMGYALVEEQAKRDPEAALEWTRNEFAEGDQDLAIHSIFDVAARSDPRSAIESLLPRVGDEGSQRTNAIHAVMQRWRHSDIASAVEWTIAHKNRGERAEALNTIGGHWAEADLAGAARYALDARAENPPEQFLLQIAEQYAQVDGEAAKEWARQLPEDRQQVVEKRIQQLLSW